MGVRFDRVTIERSAAWLSKTSVQHSILRNPRLGRSCTLAVKFMRRSASHHHTLRIDVVMAASVSAKTKATYSPERVVDSGGMRTGNG